MQSENPVTEALILAGGLGTRLRSVVKDVPKPMAPVHGKPFLSYVLDYWLEQGIRRFVLSVGYLAHTVQNYFGSSYHGATVDYVHEPEPLGTGGGLALALAGRGSFTSQRILLLNGDTFYAASLPSLYSVALAHPQAAVTMALRTIGENTRYAGVEVGNDGIVSVFGSPAKGRAQINAGCYLLNLSALRTFLDSKPKKFSLEDDLLPSIAQQGMMAAQVQNVTFIDIGIPEDYEHFVQDISNNIIKNTNTHALKE